MKELLEHFDNEWSVFEQEYKDFRERFKRLAAFFKANNVDLKKIPGSMVIYNDEPCYIQTVDIRSAPVFTTKITLVPAKASVDLGSGVGMAHEENFNSK